MSGLITKLVAGEVEVFQYKLVVLVASLNDSSDAVHLNQVATNVESLKLRVLEQSLTYS